MLYEYQSLEFVFGCIRLCVIVWSLKKRGSIIIIRCEESVFVSSLFVSVIAAFCTTQEYQYFMCMQHSELRICWCVQKPIGVGDTTLIILLPPFFFLSLSCHHFIIFFNFQVECDIVLQSLCTCQLCFNFCCKSGIVCA